MNIDVIFSKILDYISLVENKLSSFCVEVILIKDEKMVSIAKKKFNESLKEVDFEQIVNNEKEYFADVSPGTESREIIMESESGGSLFCNVFPIAGKTAITGYVIAQTNDEKAAAKPVLIELVSKVYCVIEEYKPDDSIENSGHQYKEELIKMRNIQAKLFPKFDDVKELDVATVFLPVQLMSGTFIEAFYLDKNIYQIAGCDSSGHDAASMFIGATVRTLIKSFSSAKLKPSALIDLIVERVKKMITGVQSLLNITVYQINLNTGVTYVSSYGKVRTILYNKKKGATADLGKTSIGKELEKMNTLKDITFRLDPLDSLLYYSRGVLNAKNIESNLNYGQDRINEKFKEFIANDSLPLVHEIIDDIYTYTNYANLNDDVLLVCIKRHSKLSE